MSSRVYQRILLSKSSFKPVIFALLEQLNTNIQGIVFSLMAVGRSCICSASILFLFLFCCLSHSLCHPSTFLFGFCRVLSDGEVAMNIDEMDLYLAIC